jgi:mycothiol synthase
MNEKERLMSAQLPDGFWIRPARFEDSSAVIGVFNAHSRQLTGQDEYSEQRLVNEWGMPGFNLESDSRVAISPQGNLVAYFDIWDEGYPHSVLYNWGQVHPDYQGLGIDCYLQEWSEARARQFIPLAPKGSRVAIWNHIPSIDEISKARLEQAGFKLIRHSWRMVIELDGLPPEAQWPQGIRVRTFRRGQDEREVFRVDREAFRDHFGFMETPFEEEYQRRLHYLENDENFDPSLWFLAVEDRKNGDGSIVGIALCRNKESEDDMGWVGSLGVLPEWRRKGIGLALLHHSFQEFYQRGKERVGLGVDAQNLTGATRLYRKAGMHSDPLYEHSLYEKELRPGENLIVEQLD